MKDIILPGDKISDEVSSIQNTFVEDGKTYASVLGMLDESGRYNPLELRYIPRRDDILIGIVTSVRHAGYELDVNLAYSVFIPTRDLRVTLQLGDILVGKVREITEGGRNVALSEIKRLPRGDIVDVPASKVPRIIGRKSSMLNIIREKVGGDVVVGNNGYIWISESSNIPLVLNAIDLIVKKAHLSGLTNEVSETLEQK